MVVLNEGIRDAELGELRFVEGFDEEAAEAVPSETVQLAP
jgi:hypothetical protein